MVQRLRALAIISALILAAWQPVQCQPVSDLTESGQDLYKAKRFDQAIEVLTRAVTKYPNDSDAYRFRAACYMEKGNYVTALADYSTAIRLVPRNPNPYVSCAWIYLKLGEYQQAIDAANQAIELNSSLPMAFKYKGDAHNNLKQYEEAIVDYDNAIQRDQKLVDAYRNRGLVHLHMGNFQKVIDDMTSAISLVEKDITPLPDGALPNNPTAGEYFHLRGYAFYRMGQVDDANADEHKARMLGYLPK